MKIFSLAILILALVTPVHSQVKWTPYAIQQERFKADEAMMKGIVAQAQNALSSLNGKGEVSAGLDSTWGPLKYPRISKSFGWGIDADNNKRFVVLYDVYQDVARTFNRAFFGIDEVFNWNGIGNQGLESPYGAFKGDWGNVIVFPVTWLKDQQEMLARLDALQKGKVNLIGLSTDQNDMAKLNLFWFDRFAAAGIVYANIDMSKTSNGLENLITHQFDTLQLARTREINNLLRTKPICNSERETFARKDCLKDLNLAFIDYGKRFLAANQFLVSTFAKEPLWNDVKRQLEYRNVGVRGAFCEKNAVCEAFALYGTGSESVFSPSNLVCYQLDQPLREDVAIPMEESKARQLSEKAAELRELNKLGFLVKVTQAPRVLASPRKCSEGENRIVAEGRGVSTAKIIWDRIALRHISN